MADFYFFTDPANLDSQSAAQAYGPITGSGTDDFQCMNFHTSSVVSKAITICKGIVCVQPTSNADIINLILKPLVQPQIGGRLVQYFLYKGIKRTSLISGNIVLGSPSGADHLFTTHVHKANQELDRNRNELEGTSNTTTPLKETLGVHIDANELPDSDPIDSIFEIFDANCQFPITEAGWELGEFVDTTNFPGQSYGVAILLEGLSVKHLLRDARTLDFTYSVTTLGGSPGQLDTIQHWYAKEYVSHTMDTTSFYGAFYQDEVNTVLNDGSTVTHQGNSIVDVILGTFRNKNRVYIDLRNNFNRHFNFFQEFGDQILLDYGGGNHQTVDTKSTGWPLLIIENSDIPTGNTTDKNVIDIRLPITGISIPLLYIQNGRINDSTALPDEAKGVRKFVDLSTDLTDGYSASIELALPNNSAAGDTSLIPGVVILKLLKRFDITEHPQLSQGLVYESSHFMDNLFRPFDMRSTFQLDAGVDTVHSHVYYEHHYVDDQRLLRRDFAAAVGIAFDKDNVTFFAFPFEVNNHFREVVNPPQVVAEKREASISFLEQLVADENRFEAVKSQFEIGGNTFEYYGIQSLPSKAGNKSLENFEDLISLTISSEQYAQLQTLHTSSGFLTDFPVYLGLIEESSTIDENLFDQRKYKVVLRGYEDDAGTVQIKEVLTTIEIYTSHEF